MRKVIGVAVVMASRISQIVDIEHCALMRPENQWVMEVQCRTLNIARDIGGKVLWESLPERYPDAKVEVKHNSVTVTLPPIQEYLEVAVFGTPGENDMIRNQIAIFGPKPEKGLNWTANIILYDDTEQAFEQVRQRERGRGNKLLTARAGLFVANIEDNINIELSVLQPGWRIKGSKIKVIKSRDAWKMPEDGADFPRCSCEIVHVDERKELFICGITVSHGEETTKAEVVAIFKQTLQKRQEEAATTKRGHQMQAERIVRKEREKKIQEETLITYKHKRVHLLVAITCFLVLLYFNPWNGGSEAVTRYGILLQGGGETIPFRQWLLLKEDAWKVQADCSGVARCRRKNIRPILIKEPFPFRCLFLHGEETTKAEATKSKDAWKMLADCSGVARCHRKNVHVDESKESFVGRITVSQGEETTKAEVVKICRETVGAHISDKEREKKIQEESLTTSDKHKKAVTRNGEPNATAIIQLRHWSLIKVERKKIDEMKLPEKLPYTLPTSDASSIKIFAKLSSGNFKTLLKTEQLKVNLSVHTKREQNLKGQDCRAKSHFCTNRNIGLNIITRPNYWYKLNEVIGGVRANYKSRHVNQSYGSQRQRGLMDRQQTI